MNISNGWVFWDATTNCKEGGVGEGGDFRFSKSSHDWEDLLSHLNLYNPMNISLGDNTFTATVHATKMVQGFGLAQLQFLGIVKIESG